MIKAFGGATALTVAIIMSGCASNDPAPSGKATDAAATAAADGNATVCAQWMEAQQPFLLNTAPEAKAYNEAISDSYQGKETADAPAIQHAYWSGWADTIRPLVAQADTPELKAALTAQINELDRRATATKTDPAQQPFGPIQELCLKASTPAVSVTRAE